MLSLLEAQVTTTIQEHRLVDSATQRIYIAISGGADSVALLMAMLALGYGERLEALHCNFTLRGEESDCDEAFVRELCTKLSVPLQIKRFDTRRHAEKKGISIEMAARELRYQWFRSFTEGSEGRKVVAVAHNADDQVETPTTQPLYGYRHPWAQWYAVHQAVRRHHPPTARDSPCTHT